RLPSLPFARGSPPPPEKPPRRFHTESSSSPSCLLLFPRRRVPDSRAVDEWPRPKSGTQHHTKRHVQNSHPRSHSATVSDSTHHHRQHRREQPDPGKRKQRNLRRAEQPHRQARQRSRRSADQHFSAVENLQQQQPGHAPRRQQSPKPRHRRRSRRVRVVTVILLQKPGNPVRRSLLASPVREHRRKIHPHDRLLRQARIHLARSRALLLRVLHARKLCRRQHQHHQQAARRENPVHAGPGQTRGRRFPQQAQQRVLFRVALLQVRHQVGINPRTDRRSRSEHHLRQRRIERVVLLPARHAQQRIDRHLQQRHSHAD